MNLKQRIIEVAPMEQDFRAVEIADKLYPDSIRIDSEGRWFNRATPVISRELNRMRGVVKTHKDGHTIYWICDGFEYR